MVLFLIGCHTNSPTEWIGIEGTNRSNLFAKHDSTFKITLFWTKRIRVLFPLDVWSSENFLHGAILGPLGSYLPGLGK